MIEHINTLAQEWWTWSVSIFWQVGLLILFVACLDRVIRKWTWPQVRYALWLMILVKLILPPGWYMSSSLTGQVQPLAERFINSSQPKAVTNEPITLPLIVEPTAGESTMESFSVFATQHEAANSQKIGVEKAMPATHTFAGKVDVLPGTAVDWRVYAMGLWLLGAIVLTVWLVSRLQRLRRGLPEHRVLLPTSFYMQVEKCAHALGLRRVPRVIVTDKVIVPAVMGTLRPVLLMPRGFLRQLSRKDTEHMLLHEFAHIKRGDLYVHGLYLVLQIAFWYNPLLWLVRRQLHHLRELCCDATVARLLKDKAEEYRQTLLDVARRYLARSTEPSLGLLGLFEDANRLAVRLSWLKKPTWRYARTRTLLILALVIAMTACVLPMAQANNSVAEEPSAEATGVAEAVADTDATTTDATESLSAEQRAQLEKQVQQLAQQQRQLQVQLQQLKQVLKQSEATTGQALSQQGSADKQPAKQGKAKYFDAVKDKVKGIKHDISDAEYWQQWAKDLEGYVDQIDQKFNSPEFKAWAKQYADKWDQTGQRFQAWTDSNEVRQWQKDLKQWQQDMQRWSEDMANAVQHKWMPSHKSDNDTNIIVPEQPHMSSPPAMPKMPPMPKLPKDSLLAPGLGVSPMVPAPNVNTPMQTPTPLPRVQVPDIHIPVEIQAHEHNLNDNRIVSQRSLHMDLAFTGTVLSVLNNVGHISVQGSENNDCGVRAKIRVKAETPKEAEDLAKKVKLIWDANDTRAVLKPALPDLSDGVEISVDITLTVPRQINLVLATQVGDLTVKGMQGTVKANTNVGKVSAEATDKDIILVTNVGDVSLSVAKDASATIEALTNIGSIESDFDFPLSKRTTLGDAPAALGSHGRLTVGSGKAIIRLKSNVGSVRVGSPDFVKPKTL